MSEETEVYSRIVGYYRPVKNWNLGKKSEYNERSTYTNALETVTAAVLSTVVDEVEMIMSEPCLAQ